jgi:hypothetical protein
LAKDGAATPVLANVDLDTGRRIEQGDYPLADGTYNQLLERLTSRPERIVPQALKENILAYYGSATTADPSDSVSHQLAILRDMKTAVALK